MPTTTKIQVRATDNELYILALNSAGIGSYEICHIMSGFNNPVDYVVIPQSILPKGSYNLVLIGINWGGPATFSVTLTTGGVATTHAAPAGSTVGVFWHDLIPIQV